jgi:hypothetical protein
MMIEAVRNSFWLELELDAVRQVFELRPGANRTIVVGSFARADVRIDRAGVKPVHFQFEQLGHYVLVTPASAGDVRVGGEALVQPRPLDREQWVEFGGIRMHVSLLEAPPSGGEVPPPAIRTPDPMITIEPLHGDDTEITEVIPPPAGRRLAPPRPSAAPQGSGRSSVAAPGLTSPAETSNPSSLDRTPLDGTTAVAVPKSRTASAVQSPPELPAHGSRAHRRLASIAIAGLLVLLVLVAILGIFRK